jgi:hypothetical protein
MLIGGEHPTSEQPQNNDDANRQRTHTRFLSPGLPASFSAVPGERRQHAVSGGGMSLETSERF